jgi:hypothetical protein
MDLLTMQAAAMQAACSRCAIAMPLTVAASLLVLTGVSPCSLVHFIQFYATLFGC